MLELKSNDPVSIQDYDPAWPDAFSKLAARVTTALGNLIVNVEHIGSTAVPGLAAKPIIDLDVILDHPCLWRRCSAAPPEDKL